MNRGDVPGRGSRSAALTAAVLGLGHLVLGAFDPAGTHDLTTGTIPAQVHAMWIIRIVVAAGAGVCFLLGPGLVWRRVRPVGLITNLAFVWIPGALYLLVTGTVAWALARHVDPATTSALLLLPIPVALLWCTRHWSPDLVRAGEGTALALFVLVFAVGLGVSTWSYGPEGELYGGTISRTLEVGPRSDSRISYNVIALLAHGDSPYGTQGTYYYAPYNFYARGPIAGLGAGAVVMAGGASPARSYPDAPWEPFDREGFMTYRIMMMLLNATAILSVFGLARTFLRSRLAVAAAALVALSPFLVSQVSFTWPKLLAASYVLAAAVALLRRRCLIAGLLFGLGYLAHPSALFAVPALLLAWLVLRERGAGELPVSETDDPDAGCAAAPRGFGRWFVDSLVVGAGLGLVYVGWRVLNAGHVVDFFGDYLGSAYGKVDAPTDDWIRSRLHLTANSFIPFRQVFADVHDEFTNVVGGQSPFIVRVSVQWRSAVTVAVGVLYLPVFLYGFARFVRRAVLLSVALFVVPTVAFIVFWGANTTGVLQEGLHGTFLIALVASFLGHTALQHTRFVGRWVRIGATARVAEVLFLALVPTAATTGILGTTFGVTNVFALTLVVGGALGLAVISWRALAPERVAQPVAVAPAPG